MKLRYHLLILAAIVIATVIILPVSGLPALMTAGVEGLAYGWFIVYPSHQDRQIRNRKRRGLD